MASNFRILRHQNSNSIHLKLIGEFDGSSAHQLLNTIETCSANAKKIFIHTDELKGVHPFGKAVFHNNFDKFNKRDVSFIFTGENRNTLEP